MTELIEQVKFTDLNLGKDLLRAIAKKKFVIASEIQKKIIPIIQENKSDIIGISQTGTGKTAAFGLPIVDSLEENNPDIKVAILTPTRELAIQVSKEFDTFRDLKKLKILTVYGGADIANQIRMLKKKVDIVVGTPGRFLDLIRRKILKLNNLDYLVLDEADEMLKMGFIEDVEDILETTNLEKRVYLFSATIPQKIKDLSKKYMKKQVVVEVKKQVTDQSLIEQICYEVTPSQKTEALTKIISFEKSFYGLIFCRTKVDVDNVTASLTQFGYRVGCIHGDIQQNKREKILTQFREKKIKILLATDVAARGIDVDNLSHVVNYSLPESPETYIHRIGRTGRAGNQGIAISFLSRNENSKLRFIERITKVKITRLELPNNKEIRSKRNEILENEVEEIITTENYALYDDLSFNLLRKYEPQEIISSLIFKLEKNIPQFKDSFKKTRVRDSFRDFRSERGNKKRTKGRGKENPYKKNKSRFDDKKSYGFDKKNKFDDKKGYGFDKKKIKKVGLTKGKKVFKTKSKPLGKVKRDKS